VFVLKILWAVEWGGWKNVWAIIPGAESKCLRGDDGTIQIFMTDDSDLHL
jgi:hypothetical protein